MVVMSTVGLPPPMRADARRNRELLLAAALAAFTERGADDTSLEEIARRAGVGIGTLYRHFPNRQAAPGLIVVGRELFQSVGDSCRRLLECSRYLIGRERLVGHVDHGLDHRLELRVGQFRLEEFFGRSSRFGIRAFCCERSLYF